MKRGFSTVEALLAVAVFSLLITAFSGAYLYGEESTMLAGNRARAVLLAEEGLEAVRNIRDAGFANLSDGTFGLATTGNQWSLSGASDVNDIFTRTVTVATVNTKRKQVTSAVAWQENAQRSDSLTLTTYLSNWIASGGLGNWASPTQVGLLDMTGTSDGLKIAISGNYAYVIRNVSGSQNFVVVDISTPTAPAVVGSLTLTGTPVKIAVSGNYAYVTNTATNGELQIINVTTPASPALVGTYNSPAVASGRGIAVSGTVAYLGVTTTAANEFYAVNVSNPASPVLLGSLKLSGSVLDIAVSGNYAYIASSHNSQELQIVSIAAPSSPTLTGSFNLSTNTDALAIDVIGTVVYIAQGTSGNILYTMNVATPSSPTQLGSVTVATSAINDIDVDPSGTYAFLATANNTGELRIVNVSTPSSPTNAGSMDVAGASVLNGVAYQQTQDRVYTVGNADAQELTVFAPQ
ncbi:MAG: hypothetical protein WCG84_02335 [Candidatus Moraniibacteriota bacterium]